MIYGAQTKTKVMLPDLVLNWLPYIYIESLSALLVKTPGDKLDKRVLPVSMRCWRHITHHSYGQGLFSQVSH